MIKFSFGVLAMRLRLFEDVSGGPIKSLPLLRVER